VAGIHSLYDLENVCKSTGDTQSTGDTGEMGGIHSMYDLENVCIVNWGYTVNWGSGWHP